MASLRVGVITFDWYPYEPRALRLAETAANAGYEVDVICLRQPNERGYGVHNGVHIYRVPMSRSIGGSLPITILQWCWFLLLAGVTMAWLHLRRPYNVVHVHNMPDFLVFSAFIPKLLGAKIILDVQDVSPELMAAKAKGRQRGVVTRLATFQEHISIAFAHHVVTTGWIFEEVLLQRGVPKEKITSILNSADPSLFPPSRRCPLPFESSQEGQPFIVMYHGTLAERNGLDTAIRALALAHRVVPQLRLDIQGNGEQLPALKQLAIELGVSERVVFTDSCPIDKLVDFVVHGDVGIIPYRCNGFAELVLPTKTYEFAWMCRPMIASDTRAIRSMFRPESIVLCDPSKAESFADAMIDLYQHAEKRARMIASAAEDYIPYRWELEAERYQQLLASLTYKPLAKRIPSSLTSGASLPRE
jgi:glycosyltransferase involved in cell wall biosynthesis